MSESGQKRARPPDQPVMRSGFKRAALTKGLAVSRELREHSAQALPSAKHPPPAKLSGSSSSPSRCLKRQPFPNQAETPSQPRLPGFQIVGPSEITLEPQPQQAMGSFARPQQPISGPPSAPLQSTGLKCCLHGLGKNKSASLGTGDSKKATRQLHKASKLQKKAQASLFDMSGWNLVKRVPQSMQHSKANAAFSTHSSISPGLRHTHGLGIEEQLPCQEATQGRHNLAACGLPAEAAEGASLKIQQAQRQPAAVPDLDRALQLMDEMGLNAAQKAAACACPELPLMIRAGAGTGKTTTTVARILYMTIGQGIAADHILAITFTKKASKELQERLERRGVQGVTVKTFHAFALTILKSFYSDAGYGPGRPHLLTGIAEVQSVLAEAMRWASLSRAKLKVANWLDLPGTGTYSWEDILAIVRFKHSDLYERALMEANNSLDTSLEKVRKAEQKQARDREELGLEERKDSRDEPRRMADRIQRLSHMEVIVSVYKALLEVYVENYKPPEASKSSKGSEDKGYDLSIPGLAPTRKQVGMMYKWINSRKTVGMRPEEFAGAEGLIYKEFQMLLKEMNCCDFNDLINVSTSLLRKHAGIRQLVQERCKYMLVDEYQDSNALQVELIQLLHGDRGQISVVGDDFQSIYGFRGAKPDVFPCFIDQFDHEKLNQPLEINYRSRPDILEAGMLVLRDTKSILKKDLKPGRGAGERKQRVHIWESGHPAQEAYEVAQEIRRLHEGSGVAYNDMVCLLRVMKGFAFLLLKVVVQLITDGTLPTLDLVGKAKALDKEMLRLGIPHHIVKGLSFMDQAVVKDVMAYIRLLVNPKDDTAFERVYNVPARGLGKKERPFFKSLTAFRDEKKLRSEANGEDCSLFQCCKEMLRTPGKLGTRYVRGVRSFVAVLETLRTESIAKKPSEIVYATIMETGYWDNLLDQAKNQEEKKKAESDVRGVIEEDREEEPDDTRDEEEEAAQLADLLEFVARREGNGSSKGEYSQRRSITEGSKSDNLVGPLRELYMMIEAFQETYRYGEDDFIHVDDGMDKGAPSLTRLAAKTALDAVDPKGLTGDIEHDLLQHTAALQGRGFHPLVAALENFAVSSQQDGIKVGEGVTICTIHAAKGLEWDYVFVPQLIDYNFPLAPRCKQDDMSPEAWLSFQQEHAPQFGPPRPIQPVLYKWRLTPPGPPSEMDAFERYCMAFFEEEERLLHVAITRAKEGVYLLTTRNTISKDGRLFWARPSFFLKNFQGKRYPQTVFPRDHLEQSQTRPCL